MDSHASTSRPNKQSRFEAQIHAALTSKQFQHLLDGVQQRAHARGLTPAAATIITMGDKYSPAKQGLN